MHCAIAPFITCWHRQRYASAHRSRTAVTTSPAFVAQRPLRYCQSKSGCADRILPPLFQDVIGAFSHLHETHVLSKAGGACSSDVAYDAPLSKGSRMKDAQSSAQDQMTLDVEDVVDGGVSG